jgi:molybdopterin/thiamine biosynthesis adenylyltransferase
MRQKYSYATAFSRNLGWVTQAEQDTLRHCRVAIAGMGGVGGVHLLTLARLGIGNFTIADPDTFDLVNFNRQAGAFLSSLDLAKAPAMAAMAHDINPEADIRVFATGVDAGNVDEFLRDADLYVDGLDVFALQARRVVFAACAQRGIPAITVAPLGMGAALVNFLPGKMSFEDYFRLEGYDEDEQLLRFLVGLAPAILHRTYLVDPGRIDLAQQRTASTVMACQLSAGVMGTEALKMLLGRGKVWAAPHAIQFDAFRNKLTRTWRPGGNQHPLQRLGLALIKRALRTASEDRHEVR